MVLMQSQDLRPGLKAVWVSWSHHIKSAAYSAQLRSGSGGKLSGRPLDMDALP